MNNYFYRLTIYDEYGSVVADESGDFDRLHEGVDQAKEDIEIYDKDMQKSNGYNHYDNYDYQDKGLVVPDKDHRVIINPRDDFKENEKEEPEWETVPIVLASKEELDVVVATLT